MSDESRIPRYEHKISYDFYGMSWVKFFQSEDGDYCRWEDVEAEITRLNKQIQDLRLELINTLCP